MHGSSGSSGSLVGYHRDAERVLYEVRIDMIWYDHQTHVQLTSTVYCTHSYSKSHRRLAMK